jgi:hypothetical protein
MSKLKHSSYIYHKYHSFGLHATIATDYKICNLINIKTIMTTGAFLYTLFLTFGRGLTLAHFHISGKEPGKIEAFMMEHI